MIEGVCLHCGGLKEIRMPVPASGCDHLYYPDSCAVCSKRDKPKSCGLDEGTHYACDCQLELIEKQHKRIAELEAENLKLINANSEIDKEYDTVNRDNYRLTLKLEAAKGLEEAVKKNADEKSCDPKHHCDHKVRLEAIISRSSEALTAWKEAQ